MRRQNQNQAEVLQNVSPVLPIDDSAAFRNRILQESSSFPFQNDQYGNDNIYSSSSKEAIGRPLINIANNNPKKAIIRPVGSKTNVRKIPRLAKQQAKRVQAPFATDTPPIISARRRINKNPYLNKANQKNCSSQGKSEIKTFNQIGDNEINSPRKFVNEIRNNQHSLNKTYQESDNESILQQFPKNSSIIQKTNFQNAELPLFPSSINNLKYSQFPNRTKQIEAIVKEHRKILKQLTDIIESRIPQISNDSISKIKELVDKPLKNLLSNQIQTCLSGLFEKNSIFEKMIDNTENLFQSEYQQINDFLNGQKTMISQFTSSINSFESSHLLSDSMKDVSRVNDKISFTISEKLKSIENDEVLKLSSATHLKENFDFIRSSLDDKINSSMAQTIFTIDNEYQKLAEQIQFKSTDTTKKVCDQLSSEIQNLSNSIDSKFNEFNETIEQTSISMNLSLEEFEKSYQEAIDSIQDDNSKVNSNLNERLYSSIETTHKSFEMFRNEAKSTIDAIQSKTIENNDDFLQKIQEEYQNILRDNEDVQKKFDNFISFIENERNIQLRHFFDSNTPIQFDINDEKNSVFKMDPNKIIRNEVAPDLALLNYSIECVNSVENRIEKLETLLSTSVSKFESEFESINSNLNEATEKVEKLRGFLRDDDKYDSDIKSLCGIEKMIEIIEKRPKNTFNCAQKTELMALEQITRVDFEEKLKRVSSVISEINSKIELLKREKIERKDDENQLKNSNCSEKKSKKNRHNEMTSFKYFEDSLKSQNNYSESDDSSEESAF